MNERSGRVDKAVKHSDICLPGFFTQSSISGKFLRWEDYICMSDLHCLVFYTNIEVLFIYELLYMELPI